MQLAITTWYRVAQIAMLAVWSLLSFQSGGRHPQMELQPRAFRLSSTFPCVEMIHCRTRT